MPEKKGTKIANTRVSHRRNERENAARRAKITIFRDAEAVEKPVEKPWKRRGNAWGQLSAERASGRQRAIHEFTSFCTAYP